MRCCLDCFHRFVKFINENAYIQVALTGESFCTSAMAAFVLALKNAATFFITNGIGSLIFFLGKMTISIINTAIGYLLITHVESFKEEIDNPVPVLAIKYVNKVVCRQTAMEEKEIQKPTVCHGVRQTGSYHSSPLGLTPLTLEQQLRLCQSSPDQIHVHR